MDELLPGEFANKISAKSAEKIKAADRPLLNYIKQRH